MWCCSLNHSTVDDHDFSFTRLFPNYAVYFISGEQADRKLFPFSRFFVMEVNTVKFLLSWGIDTVKFFLLNKDPHIFTNEYMVA